MYRYLYNPINPIEILYIYIYKLSKPYINPINPVDHINPKP